MLEILCFFYIVVLEKTFYVFVQKGHFSDGGKAERCSPQPSLTCVSGSTGPLDRKTHPVHPKGSQPWLFTGKTGAETEAQILWPPDAKT